MSRAARLSISLLLVAACGEGRKAAAPQPAAAPSAAQPAAATPVLFDAVAEAVASYRVGASIAPETLKKGAKGELVLAIELTRPDVHVQHEFPLKATLSAGPGLKVARSTLGHADAADPAARDRRWKVGVTAVGAKGPETVVAAVRFALCKETEPAWCVVRNDTVTATVEVR
jgi:hypothetical protein